MHKIYILCNPALVDLVQPIEVSKIVLEDLNNTCVALYDLDKLNAIPEEKYEEAGCWWRWCEWGAHIEQEKYQPRIMRREWLHQYICDVYNCSQERNVAAIISQFAIWEWKDPITFYNSI